MNSISSSSGTSGCFGSWGRTILFLVAIYAAGYLHGCGAWAWLLSSWRRRRRMASPSSSPAATEKPAAAVGTTTTALATTVSGEENRAAAATISSLPEDARYVLTTAMQMLDVLVPWMVRRFGPLVDTPPAPAAHPRRRPQRTSSSTVTITDVTDSPSGQVVLPSSTTAIYAEHRIESDASCGSHSTEDGTTVCGSSKTSHS